ncbi:hypothetical protein ABEB36_013444 [Hypothenemus hampei]|uniref:Purine nucleoside phosphorylase n=1 Tax=Hypothenemus hampei TaxID=57062 RepID=A0ABD1ECF3_HYPHA
MNNPHKNNKCDTFSDIHNFSNKLFALFRNFQINHTFQPFYSKVTMSRNIKIGIIGGSGLDNPDILKNRYEKIVSTPFGDPSDFLIIGQIGGVSCVLLARHGRRHDKIPGTVNYRANIWAMKQEGCTHIIATNACGSLQEHIPPGTLVILDGFIDRTVNREQTFFDGQPGHPEGICHMPMEPSFHPLLRHVIIEAACKIGLCVKDGGCVVAIEGPRFSSKAESLLYQKWGADLIGMTTVPEVVLAKEAGMMYATIAMATDWDCWRSSTEVVSHVGVLKVFEENVEKVIQLLRAAIPQIANENWDQSIAEMQAVVNHNIVLPKN